MGEQASVGMITEVHGPVVIIACVKLPPLRQALRATVDHENYLFEVHQHLDKHHVRAIALHRTAGLSRGTTVYDTGAPLHVPVTPGCLGRLLNIFGDPLDDDTQRKLEKSLAANLNVNLPVQYVHDKDLQAGLRITIGDWVLHANLQDELKSFVDIAHEK